MASKIMLHYYFIKVPFWRIDYTLIQQTEKVQAARQLRFENLTEIQARTEEIKYYLAEAIKAEKAGKKVEMKKTEEYVIPKELEAKFEEMPQLESSFYKLTPGRQHQYIYHIHKSDAVKQDKSVLKHEPNTRR